MAESKSGGGGCLTVIALCLAVAWCHNREPSAPRPTAAAVISSDDIATSEDENALAESSIGDDDEIKGGETFADYDARRDAIATGLYSGGDECTDDCGGHDAGREWAEQRGISSPDDCGGNSWSFEEGCRSFAEEQQATEEPEDGEGE